MEQLQARATRARPKLGRRRRVAYAPTRVTKLHILAWRRRPYARAQVPSLARRRAAATLIGAALAACGPARRALAANATEADALAVLNGVMGAYGLPKFRGTGMHTYFGDNDVSFDYPVGWVLRANTMREGVYASDFNTADKCAAQTTKPTHSAAAISAE